jgi:Secretion system C-terminal sorting domain
VTSGFPVDGCTGEFKDISVSIRNLGTSNIGKDAPIFVACDVNGERITLDTLVRSGNFATNTSINLTMSGTIPVSTSGISKVEFYTLYGADMKPWNDTLVNSFDALPAPQIDFGDVNGVLITDLPHTLDAGAGHKSYYWQDGSASQVLTVTHQGMYSVTVTGQNDCQSSRTVSINPATGLGHDEAIQPIVLYPNPNRGLFRISLDAETTGEFIINIVNIQGQTVYSQKLNAEVLKNEAIDVQQLLPGIYRVLITNNNLVYTGNMIVQ